MAREIHILRRLDHPNIIKLEGLVTSRMSCSLYLVFEYMEHDLAGLASHPDLKFTESQVEQLHKIFKLCGSPSEDYWRTSKLPHATIFKPQQPYKRVVADTFKEFPAPALGLMETLLAIDPADRGSAASALKTEFFTTRPLPCAPSSLPTYPPNKEFDAKLREEEARRQAAAVNKGHRHDSERRGIRESRAVPAPDANAELALSMQSGYGSKGSKIHYSGPLLVPSGKMDQMLKDHDHRVQEAVRRARHDKAKVRKNPGTRQSSNNQFLIYFWSLRS